MAAWPQNQFNQTFSDINLRLLPKGDTKGLLYIWSMVQERWGLVMGTLGMQEGRYRVCYVSFLALRSLAHTCIII